MAAASRFKCPACGFTVFNRRVASCEACKAPLPTTLRLNEKELALLAEEALRNERIRHDMAKEAERLEAERQRRRGDGG